MRFQTILIERAYVTLFQGGGRKFQDMDAAIHRLLDYVEKCPADAPETKQAVNLLQRAHNAGFVQSGRARARYAAHMLTRNVTNLAERRQKKQQRHADNLASRGDRDRDRATARGCGKKKAS